MAAIFFLWYSFPDASQAQSLQRKNKIKLLLIDGRSANHPEWPTWTPVLLKQLDDCGLFYVDVYTAAPNGEPLDGFNPRFSRYDVVVTTYDGPSWPVKIQKNLEGYIQHGGGMVVIHAADNAFPNWPGYNKMIGLGGWDGRDETAGPYIYVDKEGKIVVDGSPGPAGHHGPRHPYVVKTYSGKHPIMMGIPESWLHVSDELYDKLRGPGKAITILATAYSDPEFDGTDRNEPVLMTVNYGLGRIFHTTMGHDVKAISCMGFMTTLIRGCEWVATGEVTFPVPENFPTKTKTSSLEY